MVALYRDVRVNGVDLESNGDIIPAIVSEIFAGKTVAALAGDAASKPTAATTPVTVL